VPTTIEIRIHFVRLIRRNMDHMGYVTVGGGVGTFTDLMPRRRVECLNP
jgi:hypothetical protein